MGLLRFHGMAPEKKKGAHPHRHQTCKRPRPCLSHPLSARLQGAQEAGGSGRDPSRSHVSHERLVLEAGYRVICIATFALPEG